MKHSERIGMLMFRYIRDELSFEETQELDEWRALAPENEQLFQDETNPANIRNMIKEMYEDKDVIFQKIRKRYPELNEKSSATAKIRMISIAATVLITVGISIYFFLHNISKKDKVIEKTAIAGKSITPGGNHAILTLANGSSILLDSAQTGIVRDEGSSIIIKKDSGQLEYSKNAKTLTNDLGYNTLRTPRGGQYILVLPDGSKVWLNAASSIKYPSSFTDNVRKVELEGEAYFEVAKIISPSTNKRLPFIVSMIGKPDIEVLGTHFNIMAYNDEPFITTTLLEGSVQIGSVVLNPGQQARISNGEASVKVTSDVDVNAVVAWKNGKTSFKDASIQTIMRAISRWYDVDVTYKGVIPDKRFKGGLPRNTDLSELLNVLEQNGIHFNVTGKNIIVTP
jgi:transmembrane sensor